MAWQRVGLVVEECEVEVLAAALASQGAIAVEITDAEAGTRNERALYDDPGAQATLWTRCRVSALFTASADVAGAIDAATAASGAEVLDAPAFERIEDSDWVAETQRQFEPIRVSARLWIVPTWREAPDPGAVNIVLDPGAAFGTGCHPTTRLCLRWLERTIRPGDSVLDYGCGSGILAIAALKLGAGSAVGVDIDPLALETARYNAERNAVPLSIVPAGRPLAIVAHTTIANILANPLRMLAPLLVSHTQAGGSIALSGILEQQAPGVAATYAYWVDLEIDSREEDWVLLAGIRRRATSC